MKFQTLKSYKPMWTEKKCIKIINSEILKLTYVKVLPSGKDLGGDEDLGGEEEKLSSAIGN